MPSKRSKKNKTSRKLSQLGFSDPSTLINISVEDGLHAGPVPFFTQQKRSRANHELVPSVVTEAASIAGLMSASTATEGSTHVDAQANVMIKQVDERIQQYRLEQAKKEREYTLMISEIKMEIFQLKDANIKQQKQFKAAMNEEREKFRLLDLEMCKSEKDLKKVEMQVDTLIFENESFKSSIMSLKDKLKRKKTENKCLREENEINISKLKILEKNVENSSVEADAIAAETEEQLQAKNNLIEHLQQQNALLEEEAINAVAKNFADGIIYSAKQAAKAEIDFNQKLQVSEVAHIKSMDDLKKSHNRMHEQMKEELEATKGRGEKKLITVDNILLDFEDYVNSKMETRCLFTNRNLKTEKVMAFIEQLRQAITSSMTNPLH